MAIGPDTLAVGLGERKVARARAGGDDNVLGLELGRLAVRAATLSLPFAVIFPSPITTAILFFFIRCVTPWLSCLATARLRATTSARSKDGFSAKTVGVGMLQVEHLGRAQQRLGRDAAPVQTNPAEVLALEIAVLRPSCAARIAAT